MHNTTSRYERVKQLEVRKRIIEKKIRKLEQQLVDLRSELNQINRELNARLSIKRYTTGVSEIERFPWHNPLSLFG